MQAFAQERLAMAQPANVVQLRPDADLPFHPLAELFPLIEGEEFDRLVASIKADGQLDPIILYEGSVLDGRNRYRACRKLGVEPRIEGFYGEDAVRFVIAKNIHRRHLNESQRALIAAQLAPRKSGENLHPPPGVEISTPALSETQAAALLNVNRTTVSFAKRVLREGSAEEINAVRKGEASVSTIARGITDHPDPKDRAEQQQRAVTDGHKRRAQTHRSRADLWLKLKDSLDALSSLPLPADVVSIAAVYDGRTGNGGVINKRLRPTIEWLKEFEHAWNGRNG